MNPTINLIFDEYAQYIMLLSGIFSVAVNIFAVHVILTKSTRHMIPYKWLLLHVTLASAFTDIFISVLLAPVPISNAVGTKMYGLLGRLFPGQGRLYCILLIISIGYMIWSNLLCFVYRLYLLTTVQYCWMHKYLVILLFLSIQSIIGSVMIYWPALAPEENVREYANVHLNISAPHVALWLILPENYEANSRWATYCITYILCTYVVFGIITLISYRILHKMGGMSKRIVANHTMLLRSLIMQTAIPFLTFVFPFFIVGLAQELKQNPETIRYARMCSVPGMIMLSHYSVSHVAVMLVYTTPYNAYCRRLILRNFCCQKDKQLETYTEAKENLTGKQKEISISPSF